MKQRLGLMLGLMFFGAVEAKAAPKPGVARTLSAASFALPVASGVIMLGTSRGTASDNRLYTGLALISTGAAVGPSVGQWYAKGGTNAWVTFGLRTLSTGMMTSGSIVRARADESLDGLGLALALIGGGLTGALSIYDIVDAGKTAREARYESGFARLQLEDIARCGPFPCGTVQGVFGVSDRASTFATRID
ncbi:MAG: hypothetical protein AAGD10_00210 [Myxococcota bacterium]